MQESGYDGIRMERLFELLLFSNRVEFAFNTQSRVYWSCEEPISFDASSKKNNELFYRMLSKFDLVLYTHRVVQCCPRETEPSAEELTRGEIIAAYREHGLNYHVKKKEIKDSQARETF